MTFSAEQLSRHPDFVLSIRFLAQTLRDRFDEGPRISRLLASHQRWLLTQIAYALHLEYDPAKPSSGFTTVALRDVITGYHVASRNTVLSYIEELLTYRFIFIPEGEANRRPRRYETTAVSNQAMFGWCMANLAALDLFDGGRRAEALGENPGLMRLAQPRIARNCLADPAWREPPEGVALFLWTDAGGLVVDHFMSNMDCGTKDDERIEIGRVDTRALAAHFMMSRTHLQRVLRKAADHGYIGWHDQSKKTQLWLSSAFLHEYCAWQAVKFSIIDEAFAWAAAGDVTDRWS